MPGRRVAIIPSETYIYSVLRAGLTMKHVLRKVVDVSGAREGTLLVRVYHVLAVGSTASIVVRVDTTSPSADDPPLDFVTQTPVAYVTIDHTTTSPLLLAAPFGSNFGDAVRVSVVATQGGVDNQSLGMNISCELSLKD